MTRRNKATLIFLALLMIALSACGGQGACPAGSAHDAVMVMVPTLQEHGNFWGLTDFGCDGEPSLVQISAETPQDLVARVVAHEMLHVAGLVHHEASTACYLHETIYPQQTAVPCAEELARLPSISGTYEIRVLDEQLANHARGAAAMWNEYAGREVFVIVDDSEVDTEDEPVAVP